MRLEYTSQYKIMSSTCSIQCCHEGRSIFIMGQKDIFQDQLVIHPYFLIYTQCIPFKRDTKCIYVNAYKFTAWDEIYSWIVYLNPV